MTSGTAKHWYNMTFYFSKKKSAARKSFYYVKSQRIRIQGEHVIAATTPATSYRAKTWAAGSAFKITGKYMTGVDVVKIGGTSVTHSDHSTYVTAKIPSLNTYNGAKWQTVELFQNGTKRKSFTIVVKGTKAAPASTPSTPSSSSSTSTPSNGGGSDNGGSSESVTVTVHAANPGSATTYPMGRMKRFPNHSPATTSPAASLVE